MIGAIYKYLGHGSLSPSDKYKASCIKWINKKSLCVVVCSKGYPDEFKKHVEIENLKFIEFDEYDHLFHAGTTQKDEKVYAIGGRVLNFVSLSNDFSEAKMRIMQNLHKLNWSGGFYRKDIGYKVTE